MELSLKLAQEAKVILQVRHSVNAADDSYILSTFTKQKFWNVMAMSLK